MPLSQHQISNLMIPSVAAAATAGRPSEIAYIVPLSGIFSYTVDPTLVNNGTTIIPGVGANGHWVLIAGQTTTTLNKLNATLAPSASDDTTLGYSIGSLWYNTALSDLSACTDATAGAAVWVVISNEQKNNFTAIGAPTIIDDSSLFYEQGSQWLNTINGDLYTCTDASAATAVWVLTSAGTNPLASTHEVLVQTATLNVGIPLPVVTPLGATASAFNASQTEVLLNGIELTKGVEVLWVSAMLLFFTIDLYALDVITIKP